MTKSILENSVEYEEASKLAAHAFGASWEKERRERATLIAYQAIQAKKGAAKHLEKVCLYMEQARCVEGDVEKLSLFALRSGAHAIAAVAFANMATAWNEMAKICNLDYLEVSPRVQPHVKQASETAFEVSELATSTDTETQIEKIRSLVKDADLIALWCQHYTSSAVYGNFSDRALHHYEHVWPAVRHNMVKSKYYDHAVWSPVHHKMVDAKSYALEARKVADKIHSYLEKAQNKQMS